MKEMGRQDIPRSVESGRPDEKELASELSPESLVEQGAELEGRIDAETLKFDAETIGRLLEIVDGSGIPPEVAEKDQELKGLVDELKGVRQETGRISRRAQGRLKGLMTRLAEVGRGKVLAAVLLAAASFTEACAAVRPPVERPRIEEVVQTPEVRSRRVRSQAIEAMFRNEALMEQLGRMNVDRLAGVIGDFDEQKMNLAIAEMAGVDPAVLDARGWKEIIVLSDAEIEAMQGGEVPPDRKWIGHLTGTTVAVHLKGRIAIRASRLMKGDQIDTGKLFSTMVHEKNHVLTTPDGEDDSTLEHFAELERGGVSRSLNEGLTELLAVRISEKLGHRPESQGYAGGEFASAYLLERLVGTKVLAEAYFKGQPEKIRQALAAKIGKAGEGEADRILRSRYATEFQVLYSAPEGVSTVFDIIQACRRAGIDIAAEYRKAAQADGIGERLHLSDDGRLVVLAKEVKGRIIPVAVYEGEERLSPNTPPLRLHLTAGLGNVAAEIAADRNQIKLTAESVMEIEEAAAMPDITADELTEFTDSMSAWGIYLTVNVGAEIGELRTAYEKAKGRTEKGRIERKIVDRLHEVGDRIVRDLMAATLQRLKNRGKDVDKGK
ncbi:hypothetical protein AMJ57_04015 [Parcubacteria bacterium SG8_24]|nr:MAG: hypothetical protein AMJ57_04015 [Parcubacteria bacterium SG8_24]